MKASKLKAGLSGKLMVAGCCVAVCVLLFLIASIAFNLPKALGLGWVAVCGVAIAVSLAIFITAGWCYKKSNGLEATLAMVMAAVTFLALPLMGFMWQALS